MNQSKINSTTAVAGALFLMFIILGLPSGLLGVAWPSMRDSFGLTNEAVGAILFLGTSGHIIASFFSGRVVNQWGIYPTLVGSTLLALTGLTLISLTPSWWLLVASYGLWGIAGGLIDTSANVFVARYYNARMMNWMHANFGLGATFGPLLLGVVVWFTFDWRAAYGLIALLAFVLVLILLLLRSIWPRRQRTTQTVLASTGVASVVTMTEEEERDTAVSLRESLRVPAVLLGMAIFFIYGGVELTAGQWSFTLFTEGRGATPEVAGLWVTAYWAVFTLGRVLVGFVAERLGGWRILNGAMIGALVGMALYALNLNLFTSYLGLVILGFAIAPIFPTLITLTPHYVGEKHTANATGFQVGITGLGVAVLPSFAGVLAERVSLEAIGPFLFLQGVVMTGLYAWLRWRQ